jgi:hypothetical protein
LVTLLVRLMPRARLKDRPVPNGWRQLVADEAAAPLTSDDEPFFSEPPKGETDCVAAGCVLLDQLELSRKLLTRLKFTPLDLSSQVIRDPVVPRPLFPHRTSHSWLTCSNNIRLLG